MQRNLTVRLDARTIRKAKVLAAQRGTSVSRLVADVVAKLVDEAEAYDAARRRALARMDRGFHLAGRYMTREQLHER